MICPFCLENVKFKKETYDRGTFSYVCPEAECAQIIPRIYVDDYKRYPPVVVSVIGHRAHGKTVALSTLYYALSRMNMSRFWPDFYMFPINDASLEVVFENAASLDTGKLPPPNPKIFPEPTLLQVNSVPLTREGRATLLFYDTAGEAFLKTQDIGRYAGFVRRAETVLFLVSIPQTRKTTDAGSNPAHELERLLFSYIQGMADMNASTRDQNLIIVYTCADALLPELDEWPSIKQYILSDDWSQLTRPAQYFFEMLEISRQLERYTLEGLNARQFLSLAKDRFKSTHFSIISALGAAPDDTGKLSVKIKPRRIIDPLFWTLERALSPGKRKKLYRKMQHRSAGTALNAAQPANPLIRFWRSLTQ